MARAILPRVIALRKVSSPDYLREVFAAWRAGDVIAPTDDPDNLAIPGAEITGRLTAEPGGGWFDERLDLDDDPAPAQISFTSGTTGTPKPVLLSRRALSDVTRRLNAVMRVDDTIREYIGVPVTFSFGLGRARAVAAAGGRSFLPANGFRADELAGMLDRGEVNALSAVPTLLRLLIRQGALFADCGARLRWLEIGSQYMSAEEKGAVRALFPQARIVQHYGLTEASRSTFLVVSETDGAALESVGQPESAEAVRIEADGRIAVRGAHVADGIVTDSGIVPLADAEGWLTTSDLGAIDAQGYLHFKGRADHLLNVSGIKVPAELFEQRLGEEIGDDRHGIAVSGRKDALRGEAVLVAHLPGVDVARLRERAGAVASGFGLAPADVTLAELGEIPRTETGKIRRQQVTDLCARAEAEAEAVAGSTPRDTLRAFYGLLSPGTELDGSETFASLGGDSLSYVEATVLIEQAIGSLPAGWETLTLDELDARTGESPGGRRGQQVEGEMLARMLGISIITASHAWYPDLLFGLPMQGGSNILIFIFGYNLMRFRGRILQGAQPLGIVPPIFVRYILPYYPVMLIFMARDGFDWRNFLLLGVFFDGLSGLLHTYWFFETLLHLTLLLGLVFSVPPIRSFFRARPVPAILALTALALALRIGVEMVRPKFGIPPRTPDAFLYLALVGAGFAVTRSLPVRLGLAALGLAGVLVSGPSASWPILLAAGMGMVLFLPRAALPGPLARLVREVASSTIYIYLGSWFVLVFCQSLLDNRFPALQFFATFALGIVLHRALRLAAPAWRGLRTRLAPRAAA